MSGTTMVVVIVAIVVFGVLKLARIKAGTDYPRYRHGRRGGGYGEAEQIGPSQREIELQNEVTELRERVKVLERIATDDRSSKLLATEIESLRDS